MIPSEIRANFNLDITVENEAASVPSGYTPKFVLGGATSLVKAGSLSGDDIEFSFLPEDTEDLATGQYWYQVIAENTIVTPNLREFIAEGTIYVIGKITGTGAYDGRTVAEKIVEAIDATIQGKASADQMSYVIQSGSGSRSLSRMSMQDLMAARKYYVAIVAQEKRAKGDVPFFKRHTFTFVSE